MWIKANHANNPIWKSINESCLYMYVQPNIVGHWTKHADRWDSQYTNLFYYNNALLNTQSIYPDCICVFNYNFWQIDQFPWSFFTWSQIIYFQWMWFLKRHLQGENSIPHVQKEMKLLFDYQNVNRHTNMIFHYTLYVCWKIMAFKWITSLLY